MLARLNNQIAHRLGRDLFHRHSCPTSIVRFREIVAVRERAKHVSLSVLFDVPEYELLGIVQSSLGMKLF